MGQEAYAQILDDMFSQPNLHKNSATKVFADYLSLINIFIR